MLGPPPQDIRPPRPIPVSSIANRLLAPRALRRRVPGAVPSPPRRPRARGPGSQRPLGAAGWAPHGRVARPMAEEAPNGASVWESGMADVRAAVGIAGKGTMVGSLTRFAVMLERSPDAARYGGGRKREVLAAAQEHRNQDGRWSEPEAVALGRVMALLNAAQAAALGKVAAADAEADEKRGGVLSVVPPAPAIERPTVVPPVSSTLLLVSDFAREDIEAIRWVQGLEAPSSARQAARLYGAPSGAAAATGVATGAGERRCRAPTVGSVLHVLYPPADASMPVVLAWVTFLLAVHLAAEIGLELLFPAPAGLDSQAIVTYVVAVIAIVGCIVVPSARLIREPLPPQIPATRATPKMQAVRVLRLLRWNVTQLTSVSAALTVFFAWGCRAGWRQLNPETARVVDNGGGSDSLGSGGDEDGGFQLPATEAVLNAVLSFVPIIVVVLWVRRAWSAAADAR